jgi:hypothetical protein
MPGQDYPDRMPEAADPAGTQTLPAGLSRRSLLRRGGVVGAVGLAVAAGGGASLAAVASSKSHGNLSAQTDSDAAGSGPIIIYLADPKSGEMDIFAGTSVTRHRDLSMAAKAASMAPR